MISEEGQDYLERARPLFDYGKEYVLFKTSGTPIDSPLERLRLGEDLNLYVPHLAAYLFYFTEMAGAPHDYTMSFIGIKTDKVSELTETGHELHHSYGAIRQMYESPGMAPLLEQLGKMETILFLLSSFPGKSNYTHTPIDPKFEDIRTFFGYVEELMAYFNQRQLEEYHERQAKQAQQKKNPEEAQQKTKPDQPSRTEEEQKMIDVVLKELRKTAEAENAPNTPTEEDAAKIVKIIRDGTENIGKFKPPPSKDCFVATAVYQNPDHPQVDALRRWRDGALRDSVAGRAFIRWYYRVGPHLAKGVELMPGSRGVLRWVLDGVVRVVRW
ncbi:CFI-box-CTERM domain-containing protein [Neolewinella agarilytica]|uniref:CFI-box-CTERM domain-containing protein n=1 Tax=Neolewinella agarilytica TaxID=478744 RepID=UPI0023552DFD|nr:CFI-box-CTERM domain-containing protein [Neolewinella agarilytica]